MSGNNWRGVGGWRVWGVGLGWVGGVLRGIFMG